VLLRRLSWSALALAVLGMVATGSVAAQGYGPTPGPGPGMAPEMGMGPGTDLGMGMEMMMGMLPPGARSGMPQDFGWPVPCPNCRVLVDPCEVMRQCETLPRAFHPDDMGLHPTVTHANVPLYFPGGPLTCAPGRGNAPPRCTTAEVDDNDWQHRTGMPVGMDHTMHQPGPATQGPSMAPGMQAPGAGAGMQSPSTAPGMGR
jgi:hypothetical protein